jgi:HEAT repeat protein
VFQEICEALSRLKSSAGAAALRSILLAPAAGHKMERHERQRAALALVKIEGDAAEETLIKAVAAPDSGVAHAAFSGAALAASRLSVPVRTRLALAAMRRQPEGISPWEGSFASLLKGVPATARGDLVRAAFGSSDESARSWAANEAAESLSPGYVDALVALLSDPAQSVRANARRALLKYRQVEDDSDWVKSIATRRALAKQINALLDSNEPQHRMAGIAGLVAHGGPDIAARLLDVAARDGDDDVAAEARRALMALGHGSRTIADTARAKKDGK